MNALFLLMALAALTHAHVKVYYQPTQLPIRNAATATSDGTYSTDVTGCGGAATWGQNGYSNLKVGQTLNILVNYGTGTNGDHALATNTFRVMFVNLDAQDNNTNNELALVRSTAATPGQVAILVASIPAAGGSTPSGYPATVTIPFSCNKCVLVAIDQRDWGGCWDISAQGTVAPVSMTTNPCASNTAPGWQCDPMVTPCCTVNCQFGVPVSGCPCVNNQCNSGFVCQCESQATCPKPVPMCVLNGPHAVLDENSATARSIAAMSVLFASLVALVL